MATPAAVQAASAAGAPTNPFAQVGRGIWRLLTSVDFAVAQIIFLSILAAIGMTLQQLPDFAFRSPADYATAIEAIHIRYDPVLGPGIVNVLERLGAFSIFKSPIFGIGLVVLVVSIVVCTLIARRACGGTCPRSASHSPSRSSIRGCPTARR